MTWGIPQVLLRQIKCPLWLRLAWARYIEIVFHEQSTTTRFFFGWTTIGFGSFFWFAPTVHADLSEYKLMLVYAPDWVWAMAFAVNGTALVQGAWTNRYSKLQMFLEGALGVIVWVTSAYCVTTTQGAIGAHAMGALIAFWVYIRHPENKKDEQ